MHIMPFLARSTSTLSNLALAAVPAAHLLAEGTEERHDVGDCVCCRLDLACCCRFLAPVVHERASHVPTWVRELLVKSNQLLYKEACSNRRDP